MKNYSFFSLMLACFLMKFAAAVASDVSKVKAQSIFIQGGGSYSGIGDQPATVDSVIHLGPPYMDGVRVYCTENNITYRALGGVWIPLNFLYRQDTVTMLVTKSQLAANNFIHFSDTVNFGPIMTESKAMGAIGEIDTRIDDTALVLRAAINQRVKYTDTASMLSTYASKSKVLADSIALAAQTASRVKYTDTSSMLAPYLRKGDTASLSNRINSKLNISDTTGKWKPASYSPSSAEISSALGFTPYSAANPSGYVTTSGARSAISLTTTGSGAATYNSTTGILNVPIPSLSSGTVTSVGFSAGTGISLSGTNPITSSGTITVINSAPDQTVTLTAGRGIAITGTYPSFTISLVTPTVSIASRSLNSNFTISTTKEAIVNYSVTCSVTNPLLAGSSTAMVYLEYSLNSGSTWLLPSQNGNSSAVGVAVAIAITNTQTVDVGGVIPANALVRLRTATTGTASCTYITGSETTY